MTKSRACALLSVFCYYVSPTARFAILYRPSVAIVAVVVTVCSAGISEDTPAPSVASSAIGTVSVFFSVRRRARLRKKHPCCFCQRSLVIYHFVCLCFFSHFVFSQNYSEIAENSLCKFREWLSVEKHRREAFCGGVSAILNTSQIRKSDA